MRESAAVGYTPPTNGIDVTVRAGKTVHADIPNAPPARFRAFVFQDDNKNGRPAPGEIGLPFFKIYFDLNHDGIEEWGEPFGGSDAFGFLDLTPVAAGTYQVRIESYGEVFTTPRSYTTTLIAGGSSSKLFGVS